MTRLALILGLLALPVVLYAAAEYVNRVAPARRRAADEATTLSRVAWRGGEARAVDYATHPGQYDTRVEWHGPQGERVELYAVGDHEPELAIDNDHLIVRWFVTEGGAPGPREVRFEEPR